MNNCLTFPEKSHISSCSIPSFFLLQLRIKLNFECLFISLHHSICCLASLLSVNVQFLCHFPGNLLTYREQDVVHRPYFENEYPGRTVKKSVFCSNNTSFYVNTNLKKETTQHTLAVSLPSSFSLLGSDFGEDRLNKEFFLILC